MGEDSLIFTSTTLQNMKSLALAVCEVKLDPIEIVRGELLSRDIEQNITFAPNQGDPILLEGSTGVGKTALIEELARITGNQGPPLLLSWARVVM